VRLRPIPSAGLGPRGGVIGGAGIGISSHTREREAAAAYARWVASPEIQRTLYVEAGGQPGHRSAWLDDHANALATDFFRDTLPGLDAGYLRPRYDGQTIVQNEGGDIFYAHLRDRGDRTALLDTLDALYRRSLEGVTHG
jgi:multiple sugar transport system substrate-binding protein